MCSIMGYCGKGVTLQTFRDGFDATVSRGPDESRIIDTGNGILGFHRLAIMGLTAHGMQPFSLGKNYVICNGELYGFEKDREELRKKGYTFASDSDCEIILPLYKEYGLSMFEKLDAEFACVIYDGENGQYVAARDPIGIRPLYYGYDKNRLSDQRGLFEHLHSRLHVFRVRLRDHRLPRHHGQLHAAGGQHRLHHSGSRAGKPDHGLRG